MLKTIAIFLLLATLANAIPRAEPMRAQEKDQQQKVEMLNDPVDMNDDEAQKPAAESPMDMGNEIIEVPLNSADGPVTVGLTRIDLSHIASIFYNKFGSSSSSSPSKPRPNPDTSNDYYYPPNYPSYYPPYYPGYPSYPGHHHHPHGPRPTRPTTTTTTPKPTSTTKRPRPHPHPHPHPSYPSYPYPYPYYYPYYPYYPSYPSKPYDPPSSQCRKFFFGGGSSPC